MLIQRLPNSGECKTAEFPVLLSCKKTEMDYMAHSFSCSPLPIFMERAESEKD